MLINIYNLYDLIYACQRERNGKAAKARKTSQAMVQEVKICTHKESSSLRVVLL
jgi:hypothetical protein